MSQFYDELGSIASEVLSEFQSGSFVYIEPATPGATPYDPATPGDEHAINGGIATQYRANQYSQRLSSATMRIVFPSIDPATSAAIDYTPEDAGQIKIDGVTREIVAVEKSLAAGDAIVWKIYAKG